jgi:hypothetical protein
MKRTWTIIGVADVPDAFIEPTGSGGLCRWKLRPCGTFPHVRVGCAPKCVAISACALNQPFTEP